VKIIYTWLAERRRNAARRRLEATMKPCPEIRERRLKHMSPKRAERAMRNMALIAAELRGDA
jgi:hypothetical protein